MGAGNDIQIVCFDRSLQGAFRSLVLEGMAERWGSVDESLNRDLDDIDAHYGNDRVLVALDGPLIVGTGILLLRVPDGEIVRMSVHRDYRRRGIARRLIVALVQLAADVGVTRLVVETNAEWRDAQRFYEAFGFTFTHSSPGAFGRENFYELPV